MPLPLSKIISGGQTGVDRGALDATLEAGFPCGGWCPQGRKAEDGVIPPHYPLLELAGAGYRQRTRRNVVDADATLVLHFGALTGGTRETVRFCERLGKPILAVDGNATDAKAAAERAAAFVQAHLATILNVAGPRASQHPGAQGYAKTVIRILLGMLREASSPARGPTRPPLKRHPK